jgi:HlyD family secretion protein
MRRLILLLAVIAAGAGTAGWTLGHHAFPGATIANDAHGDGAAAGTSPPVPVGIATVVRATFERTLLAYGQVSVAPESIQGVSAPYDCLVSRVTSVIGQHVHRGDALIDVEPGLEVRQQQAEARLARTSAEQDLALVRQRRELSLATQTDVSLAQHAFDAADQRLTLLLQRTAGDGLAARHLLAPVDGMVVAVTAKPGTAAAAGSDLVDVAPGDHREVRLGVEAGAVAAVQVGQAISLQALNGPADALVAGTVAWITTTLDPTTHLIDVVVALPGDARVLDHERMVARIPLSIPGALVVPRSALVSDDNGTKVFVVTKGKAERTLVTVIAENDTRAALAGSDLAEGMVVVSDGASLLDDGQAVLAAPAPVPAHPAGPAPAPSVSAP